MTWIDSHAPRKFPDHQISPPQRTEGDDLVALFHHATHLKGWVYSHYGCPIAPRCGGFLKRVLKGYKENGEWIDARP